MSDLLNTAAGTLTTAAAGTHVDISFTPEPGIRNNWNPQPVQISGTLDAVRVYGHGSVRVVVDGKEHFLPRTAPVKVAPHLRVPDSAETVSPAADARLDASTVADVRAAVIGKRIGVRDLNGEHLGRTVEFEFQGTRFYGSLTAVKEVVGMISVTLDGSERFLFDDEQALIVRLPIAHAAPATTAPTVGQVLPPQVVAPVAQKVPVQPAQPAAEPALVPTAAWVPVPADELEFA